MADTVRIQTAILAAVIASAVAAHLLLRYRRSRLHLHYASLNLNLVAWYVADAMWVSSGYEVPAIKVFRLLVATVIPVSALRFFRTFSADDSPTGARAFRAASLVSGALAVLVVIDDARIDTLVQGAIFAYIFLSLFLTVYVLRVRTERLASLRERDRGRVLVVGGAVTFTLALIDYMPHVGTYFAGNILTAIYIYFLYEVLVRLRLMDLYELIAKATMTATFAVLLTCIWGLVVFWWRGATGPFLLNAALASFVVVILFDPLRVVVEERLGGVLVRRRRELGSRLKDIGAQLAGTVEPRELGLVLTRGLDATRRVTHAAVYLAEGEREELKLTAWCGARPRETMDPATHGPLFGELGRGRPVVLEVIEARREDLSQDDADQATEQRQHLDAQARAMRELGASVAVPLLSGRRVVGCITARDERVHDAFTSDELRALGELGVQAAIAFEGTRAYERVLARDRLAALGEMSAGLAHEIRNPLGAIKGAAQLLVEGPETSGEFVDIIVEEVDRLDGVVRRFLDYARPHAPLFASHDVGEVVRRSVQVLRARREPHSVVVELPESLPRLRTDADMLHQVLLNLGINAFQAMAAPGTLRIRTELGQIQGVEAQRVCVRFIDTGIGLSPEQVSKVFMPFYTTRKGGTGLGLAICDRIVRQLGGCIEVESLPGRGSTFSVCLPLEDEPT
ncbi:MAG: hypothetical protein AMXMBFR64_25970 [Myxococcales bacterium]